MPARSRALLWAVVLVVFAASIYTIRIRHEMVDFDVYRTTGARAIAGEPLYRPDDGHYQFKYFPAFAFLMAPFSGIDLEAAKVVWFGLSVALLVVFVDRSVAALPDRRRSRRLLVWSVIVLMAKFYAHELTLGQTNILLGVILVSALTAAQAGRHAWSGALVAVGALVKPYALILLPWLAVSGGAGALATSALVLAAGLVAPALVYGWSANLQLLVEWWRTVTETTAPNLLVAENVSLGAMWARWIGIGPTANALSVATALVVLTAVLFVWSQRRRVPEPNYLEFGLLMLLVPLVSPQGWDYVFLLATPAIVVVIDRLGDMTTPWRGLAIVSLALMSFTIYDLLGRTLYLWFMSISIVSVAALGLVACLAYLRTRALA